MSLLPSPLPEHANTKDRDEIIEWSRRLLVEKDFVVLDTETTGFAAGDEVVQIGIIDADGKVLMDELVKPLTHKRMPRQAEEVHGISMKMLKNAPLFGELIPVLLDSIAERWVVCYNSAFDMRLLEQSARISGQASALNLRSDCAMLAYSQFIGAPNRYRNGYAWQKLPRRAHIDHRAVDDCFLTLDLIRELALVPRSDETLVEMKPAATAVQRSKLLVPGMAASSSVVAS